MKKKISTYDVFNRDVSKYGSYKYSKKKLSSIIATNTETKFILKNLIKFRNLNLIDFGCGDGTFTKKLLKVKPNSILAIDPAKNAIKFAKRNCTSKRITYKIGSLASLNTILNKSKKKKYDVLILRGVVHHFADKDFELFFNIISKKNLNINIVLLEPNGLNLILKVIEKTSKYHIEHNEKSYTHFAIKKKLQQAGYKIMRIEFFKITPYFCPNWLAVLTNFFHNLISNIPILKNILCGNYIISAKKNSVFF
jgi:SAM-dependent methyltransferase